MSIKAWFVALITLTFLTNTHGQESHQHHNAEHAHKNHQSLEMGDVHHQESLFLMPALWTSHRQEALTLSHLNGSWTILTMIYANCKTACPVLINDMVRIQQSIPEDYLAQARFVVVTFDTATDSPEALASFAQQLSLDQPHWHFLHGDAIDIRTLATLLGIRYRQREDGNFDHSNVIALLDPQGRIALRQEGLFQQVTPFVDVLLSHYQ